MNARPVFTIGHSNHPLDCHRTMLVGQALDRQDIRVCHILANGDLQAHENAMERLLAKHGMSPIGDLLKSRRESIDRALALQTGHTGD